MIKTTVNLKLENNSGAYHFYLIAKFLNILNLYMYSYIMVQS